MKKFIKNYFIAIVAVMMIVGFSAFKLTETGTEGTVLKGCAVKKFDDLTPFKYVGTVYTIPEVEKIENWENAESDPSDCDEEPERACMIWVSEDFITSDPIPQLSDALELVAALHSQKNTAYVVGSNDGDMEIANETTP